MIERKMLRPRPRLRVRLPKPRLRLPKPRPRKPPMPTRANVLWAPVRATPWPGAARAGGATVSSAAQESSIGTRAFTAALVPEADSRQTGEVRLRAQRAGDRDRYVRADRGRHGEGGAEEDE